jgi:hypothetical protein
MKTNGKMKAVGYTLIGFALVSSILVMIELLTSSESIELIKFWAGVGITLVFGNVGKRLVGGVVQSRGYIPEDEEIEEGVEK